MTFSELVDETVVYYTNNPRSKSKSKNPSWSPCKYAGPNGERCAAARLCDESATDLEAMDRQLQTAWVDVCNMATLKPEYAHFTTDQIMFLQEFHDRDSNWIAPLGENGAQGLSVLGKKWAHNLKSRY